MRTAVVASAQQRLDFAGPDTCVLRLPTRWVRTQDVEVTLLSMPALHSNKYINIVFPNGCLVMVAAAVRILSLANQLALSNHQVSLEFEGGDSGTMGYLGRIGFFDQLHSNATVYPSRPITSAAEIYRGRNIGVVEIERISPNDRAGTKGIQSRLSRALINAYAGPVDRDVLEGATWTIFSELIENIYNHSKTQLDGYAALQVYPNAKKATVTVSDSGIGIIETLRPTLLHQFPRLAGLSDAQLLLEIFRNGVSRHGETRGCGLYGCAQKALKFRADLEVRLPSCRVQLKPNRLRQYAGIAYFSDNVPPLEGTHISFDFHLDAAG